jgi:hypothetical protein
MSVLHCPACKATMVIPLALSSQMKKEIAATVKQGHVLAMDLLRKNGVSALPEAKAIVTHLTDENGNCHRCNTQQEKAEVTFCPKCKTLNLNWSGD